MLLAWRDWVCGEMLSPQPREPRRSRDGRSEAPRSTNAELASCLAVGFH
jgi:hypothetical protein